MTKKEYDAKYDEALDVVRRMIVGSPTKTHDGTRYVEIDGKPCTDEDVFAKAWDRETAREIMSKRPSRR